MEAKSVKRCCLISSNWADVSSEHAILVFIKSTPVREMEVGD